MRPPLGASVDDFVVHRKLLGDQPRYRAVKLRIADKFEPP